MSDANWTALIAAAAPLLAALALYLRQRAVDASHTAKLEAIHRAAQAAAGGATQSAEDAP